MRWMEEGDGEKEKGFLMELHPLGVAASMEVRLGHLQRSSPKHRASIWGNEDGGGQ